MPQSQNFKLLINNPLNQIKRPELKQMEPQNAGSMNMSPLIEQPLSALKPQLSKKFTNIPGLSKTVSFTGFKPDFTNPFA